MSDFAENNTTNVATISDADWSLGFGSCGNAGLEATSANLNGIIVRLCESFVQTVAAGQFITVDAADAANPIVSVDADALAADTDFVNAVTATLATALCADTDFLDCITTAVLASPDISCTIANKVLEAFTYDALTGVLTIADGVDANCNFTSTGC